VCGWDDPHSHQHEWIFGEQADHREVVDGAVRQRLVKRHGDGVTGGNAHQRIAVGRHAGDLPGRDPAAGARPRIDHDLLTQTARQPVGDDARDDVARPARRKAMHERDGAIRPDALSPSWRRGACGDANERGAAGELAYDVLPLCLVCFAGSVTCSVLSCRARMMPQTRGGAFGSSRQREDKRCRQVRFVSQQCWAMLPLKQRWRRSRLQRTG